MRDSGTDDGGDSVRTDLLDSLETGGSARALLTVWRSALEAGDVIRRRSTDF